MSAQAPVVIRPGEVAVFDPILARFAVFASLNCFAVGAPTPIRWCELLSIGHGPVKNSAKKTSNDEKTSGDENTACDDKTSSVEMPSSVEKTSSDENKNL